MKKVLSLFFILAIVSITAPPRANAVAPSSRGYFTSVSEVQQIKIKAQSDTNLQAKINSMVSFAGTPTLWPYGAIFGQITAPSSGTCSSPQDSSGPSFLKYNEGARLVYAKVLAYHFTGNVEYASVAREKILELTNTSYYGGELYNGANQCTLELAFSLPLWIQSADLLAGSSVWSEADQHQFQNWLSSEVYKKVAWASRSRANNWGSAGSTAAIMLADYVSSQVTSLQEVQPTAKTLTPAQAYQEHIQQTKDRMSGVFKGDSQCSVWGIQTHGGIPDELRRGAAGCAADSIQALDNSLVYQLSHTDFLILAAEVLWHRGNTSIYDQIANNGKGSLKKAIDFVINNPKNAATVDWEAYRKNHLFLPARYYHDSVMTTKASESSTNIRGTFIAFAHITHADLNSTPPVTSPPSDVVSTCDTDINLDGFTDLSDYSFLVQDFFQTMPSKPRSDINKDGIVDLSDYSLLVSQFLQLCE